MPLWILEKSTLCIVEMNEVEEMKNKEKFSKEIAEIACDGGEIAISKETRKPVPCDGCRCIDCALSEKYGCSNAFREWAESEYIEKPVISKKDRAFLDYIKEDFKYMTRNDNGKLYAYKHMPIKASDSGYWGNGIYRNLAILDIDFPMVKLDDDEPWLIEDLKELEVVEEYE